MKKSLFAAGLVITAVVMFSPDMKAEWGTLEAPGILMSVVDDEAAVMKTARTADGKTFVSWLRQAATGGYDLNLQLLDANGEPMWGENGIVVEDKPNASWTADYWMVVSPEGDAIISWADARSDDELKDKHSHDPVLYKVSPKKEMLWGLDGITLGSAFQYPPRLYRFGNDIYCMLLNDYAPSKITRLNKEGTFAFEPVELSGQLIASEGTDFLSVYTGEEGTEAMRYTRDIKPVWNQPAVLSTYAYNGYELQPYTLVSDGKGGAVVSFSRDLGELSHMPVVAYVTADGNAVFGKSVDVIDSEDGDHEYNILAVNTETETILSTWEYSMDFDRALDGQMMDYSGNRLWGAQGKFLMDKESKSGFGYGPIAAYPLNGDKWLVVATDMQAGSQSLLYFNIYDSKGNLLDSKCTREATDVEDCWTYLEGDDFYMMYVNTSSDDDKVLHSRIMTIKMNLATTESPHNRPKS